MSEERQFRIAQERLFALLRGLRERQDAAAAKIAEHRAFIEQAPNITQYEAGLRIAELRTLGEQLRGLAAEVHAVEVERQRIERQMVLAGYPVQFNDNNTD